MLKDLQRAVSIIVDKIVLFLLDRAILFLFNRWVTSPARDPSELELVRWLAEEAPTRIETQWRREQYDLFMRDIRIRTLRRIFKIGE